MDISSLCACTIAAPPPNLSVRMRGSWLVAVRRSSLGPTCSSPGSPATSCSPILGQATPRTDRSCSLAAMARTLRIAVIGQSAFATDVYRLVRKNGHTVVGVFTVPDKNGREVPQSS